VTVFTPLLTGGSIAIPENPAMIDLPEWFDRLRPTWYSAAPTLHRAILDKARTSAKASAMHSLRFIISGGAPLPQAVREDLQAILKVDLLRKDGEPLMKQEDLHAPHTLYERVQDEAVRLALTSGRSRRAVAVDLGVGLSTLRHWLDRRREREIDAPPADRHEDMAAELKRLRRENEILHQERDILKKATAFFAKEGSR
jgi:transposase